MPKLFSALKNPKRRKRNNKDFFREQTMVGRG
jgi:hypothetical protein